MIRGVRRWLGEAWRSVGLGGAFLIICAVGAMTWWAILGGIFAFFVAEVTR